jgi:hypothetical protein
MFYLIIYSFQNAFLARNSHKIVLQDDVGVLLSKHISHTTITLRRFIILYRFSINFSFSYTIYSFSFLCRAKKFYTNLIYRYFGLKPYLKFENHVDSGCGCLLYNSTK